MRFKLKNIYPFVGLLVAVVLIISLNVISRSELRRIRIDLSEDRLYTLSSNTKTILASLEETITLRFFFSEKLARDLPSFRVYANRVYGLLQEYERLAKGKIKLVTIDPEPFSDAEDRAIQYGIQGVPIDQASGQRVYFGLFGTNTIDDTEVIPFFQQTRETFLEYDLTRLIYNLDDPVRSVIGVLGSVVWDSSGTGIPNQPTSSYALYDQLQQLFDLRVLSEEDVKNGIDTEITVLMIARPKGFNMSTLYAIDQFILSGRKALVLLDPFVEVQHSPTPPGGVGQQAVLPELLQAWGIELEEGKFVADPNLAIDIRIPSEQRAVPYPVWLRLSRQYMNSEDVTTESLRILHLASAGSLKPSNDKDITFIPLLSSSSDGYMMEVQKLSNIIDPRDIVTSLSGETQVRTLAARINGHFTTIFPDGPPNPENAYITSHLMESTVPVTTLIIVADTDFIENPFWVRERNVFGQKIIELIAENANFVINALDNLSGSEALIDLRRGQVSNRPFLKFNELKIKVANQFLERERELQKQLRQTEQEILTLQNPSQTQSSETLLSTAESSALENFRNESLRIRKELRNVQYQLNVDIENLSDRLKVLNILVMPLLIFFLALFISAFKRVRYLQNRKSQ